MSLPSGSILSVSKVSGHSNDITVRRVREKVEAFYQQHIEIKESHGLKHVLAVVEHAQKAIHVHLPPLSFLDSRKVLVAALLHDVDDDKYFPNNEYSENARAIMTSVNLDETMQSDVVELISYVSCSKNKNHVPEIVVEDESYWKLIPRWSDRLEAVGSVGVVRCYQYTCENGALLSSIQSPRARTIKEVWEYASPERFEAYDGNSTDMISHYYDKLLHIARPPANIVRNSYLETAALESSRELMNICLQYGQTGVVDEEYIKSLSV